MKKYKINNLDCQACSIKIEDNLKRLGIVKDVSIDFATQTILLDTEDIDKVQQVIDKIEPGVFISESISDNYQGKFSKQFKCDQKFRNEKSSFLTNIISFMKQKKRLFILIALLSGYIIGLILKSRILIETKSKFVYFMSNYIIFIIIYMLSGYEIIIQAIKNLLKGGFFDENLLMSLASIGAFIVGAPEEASAVMLLYNIGLYLEDRTIDHSRKSIKALLELKPEYATVLEQNEQIKMFPSEVKIGQVVLVKIGEKIPCDGTVIEGNSYIDASMLTGESIPIFVKENSNVLAGTINMSGILKIKVTKTFQESSINRIMEIVENATHKKAKTELFFNNFARVYTPIVFIIALITAIVSVLFFNQPVTESLYRACVILVISCPCALVISVPLSYFAGLGAASKKGILIKGSNLLDALTDVETVVFDKTGTLTEGKFKVSQIMAQKGYSEKQILEYAAYCEFYSNHPIANSIRNYYYEIFHKNTIDTTRIKSYKEIPGLGVSAIIDGNHVVAGNAKLLNQKIFSRDDVINSFNKENGMNYNNNKISDTTVYMSINDKYAGCLIILDNIKKDSKTAIEKLKKIGVKDIFMLTGDNEEISSKIAKQLNIERFYSKLLPEDKLTILEKIIESNQNNRKKKKIAFVGDGINDIPAIARTDIGISMGDIGSDAAIEAADIVIANDSPAKIPIAIELAKKTRKLVLENISFAIFIKALFLIMGFFGLATMWEAVFADIGVTIITIFNSLRVLKR
ncbi:MAG TPA: heavy metal translocating P-type ATPase [Exilispira sp.]|nr:heavy metal translocating P-type ATPase [Exilispira sp.]